MNHKAQCRTLLLALTTRKGVKGGLLQADLRDTSILSNGPMDTNGLFLATKNHTTQCLPSETRGKLLLECEQCMWAAPVYEVWLGNWEYRLVIRCAEIHQNLRIKCEDLSDKEKRIIKRKTFKSQTNPHITFSWASKVLVCLWHFFLYLDLLISHSDSTGCMLLHVQHCKVLEFLTCTKLWIPFRKKKFVFCLLFN